MIVKEQNDLRIHTYDKCVYDYINYYTYWGKPSDSMRVTLSLLPPFQRRNQSLSFFRILPEIFYTNASIMHSSGSPMEAVLPPVEVHTQIRK